VSPEPRVERTASALGQQGHEVEVLAWDRSCNHAKIDTLSNYRIRRIGLKAPYGKPIVMFFILLWNLREFVYLLKSRFDVIHACDLDTLIPAMIAAKIRGGRLVYDCFDFYSDCLPGDIPRFMRRLMARFETKLANKADLVIIVDEFRRSQFSDRLINAVVICNSPSEDLSPIIRDSVSNVTRVANNGLEIFYAGLLDKSRGFGQIIRATENELGISIIIAGFGRDEQDLIDLFSNAKNIKFLGKISHEEVLQRTMHSDVLIALYDPKIPNHRYSCPNKLFEAMMCSKPIIVSDSTLMADIVKRENCGIAIPYDDVQRLRESVVRLREDAGLRFTLGKNGREAYMRAYSWKEMENRLANAYRGLKSR